MVTVTGLVIQTPKTRALLQEYIENKGGNNYNVVAHGGYYHLESLATSEYGLEKLKQQQQQHSLHLDVVKCGGWYKLQQLAADPKGMLIAMILYEITNKGNPKTTTLLTDESLYALLTLLEAQGKGFSADLVDGPWYSVFNKSTQASPKLQKLVERQEDADKKKQQNNNNNNKNNNKKKNKTKKQLNPNDSLSGDLSMFSTSDFDVAQSIFSGVTPLFRKRVELSTKVAYTPVKAGYTKLATANTNSNKIVLRRIACDIVGASIKLFGFLKIPLSWLFRRQTGGYLDFIYMDKDIRVTKGNRGGIFVHFRPEFLKQQLAMSKSA